MCGIVGYLGKGQAYPALIKGLKRLEYRGYDSAGVALISEDGSLNVYKAKGKVVFVIDGGVVCRIVDAGVEENLNIIDNDLQ